MLLPIAHSHHKGAEFAVLAVRISTPLSVHNKVCSNCALFFPSLVTAVHPSGQVTQWWLPSLIMGSIVKVIPACIVPGVLFFS